MFKPVNVLPTSANKNDLVMLRSDGKIYRFDGTQWSVVNFV